MENFEQYPEIAIRIRKNIIEAGWASGVRGGHFGGSLSVVDILTVLYKTILKYDVKNPLKTDRDRFILSKGHCAQALYAALHEFGFISKEQLLSFNADNGDFPSHCVLNPQYGIELSSGSLGIGLSFAIGQALALNQQIKHYVLVGNGELNEGSVWEAIMFAGHKNIDSICLILDDNGMQLDGFSNTILPISNWKEKFSAFLWDVVEIDGHNFNEIEKALTTIHTGRPLAIIAHTVKGKGISFMENNPQWHHHSLNQEQYNQALIELGDALC